MSLDHILLGALSQPQSGYDLKRWFDDVFSFFWNADQSQIYRTVNRLNGQGLVSAKSAPSAIGPDKRLYRTTAKGRAELKRWLLEGPVAPAQRTAIYVQLIFLSTLPDADAARFLAAMKAQADQLVVALEKTESESAEHAESQSLEEKRVEFFNRASLELGIARARATQTFVSDLVQAHAAEFREGGHGNAA